MREKALFFGLLVAAGCFNPAVSPSFDTDATSDGTVNPTSEGSTDAMATDTTTPMTSAGTSEADTDGCMSDDDCVDDDPCSIDTCDGGTCAHAPNVDDPECACESPADCAQLPMDGECQTRTCIDSVCGLELTPAGTPLGETQQTAEDCKTLACDGDGGMEVVNEDADLPVDGLECTTDECTDGEPSNPPVGEGTECAAGVCDADGQCVGCNTPADCGGESTFCATVTCDAGVCGIANTAAGTAVPAQTPNDCEEVQCDGNGNEAPVADDSDLPADDGNGCTGEVCSDGQPSHPGLVGQACNDGLFCNGTDSCNASGSCGVHSGNPCNGADGDSDCSESCSESANSCTANDPNGSSCGTCRSCSSGSCTIDNGDDCGACRHCSSTGACVFECVTGEHCCTDADFDLCIPTGTGCP
jgi:hypothetical protein